MRRYLISLALLLLPVAALSQAVNKPLNFAEDTAHVSGDRGVMLLGVRKDTATSLCSADGKYCMPIFDANGKLWVNAASDSELPAAAALADNTANPTVPGVGAFGLWWDGATWDRASGTAADGLLVNLGANNDVDTELPAAGALADNLANPTVTAAGAYGLLWDGATWDRAAGTSADGALVNLGTNNDVTLASTTLTATVLPAGAAALVCGRTDVPATGTAVNVAANACKEILVSCPTGNTSDCYLLGGAGNGVTGGAIIGKGDEVTLSLANTNLLWVDAGTNGDDVSWCCVN